MNHPIIDDTGAMTLREFMSWASISSTTVYKHIHSGRLKAVKCGRRTLIRNSDAMHWLNNLPELEGVAA